MNPNNAYGLALRAMRRRKPNQKKVLALLRGAARNGDGRADYALGTWYLHGTNVRKNARQAITLLRRAAKKNISDAMFDLAVCYEKGNGVRASKKSAFELYLAAALHGDKAAVFEVGRCLYYGIGTKKNHAVADWWLALARRVGTFEKLETRHANAS